MKDQTKFFLIFIILFFSVNAELRRSKNAHKQQLLAQEIVNNRMRINLKTNMSVDKKLSIMNLAEEQRSIINKKDTYMVREFNKETKKIDKFDRAIIIQKAQGNKSMIEKNAPHEVSLTNHFNTFYTGNVYVGTKQIEFRMIFDTGSTLIFLNSIKCLNVGCVKGHQYDPASSPTFKDIDQQLNSEFGSGTMVGDMAIDTFFVADMEVKDVKFFEILDQQGQAFEQGDFDGLIGLAFPALGQGVETIVDYMKKQNLIERNVVSFYLTRQDGSEDSFISFGVVDHEVAEGSIRYHKVKNPMYWSVMAEEIRFGGENTGLCSKEKPCPLAIDSGTSIIAGPTNAIGYLSNMMVDKGYGCHQIDEMPALSFIIDGEEYIVLAEEYIVSTDGSTPNLYEHIDNPMECSPALIPLDVIEPSLGYMWILGDTFMSKYYTVFDRDNGQIGFAKLKGLNERFYQAPQSQNSSNGFNFGFLEQQKGKKYKK